MPTVHALARYLEGAFSWPLPLCWDAEQRQRGSGGPADDELWWLSVDHGAIHPADLVVSTDRAEVTCGDCLGWLHA